MIRYSSNPILPKKELILAVSSCSLALCVEIEGAKVGRSGSALGLGLGLGSPRTRGVGGNGRGLQMLFDINILPKVGGFNQQMVAG